MVAVQMWFLCQDFGKRLLREEVGMGFWGCPCWVVLGHSWIESEGLACCWGSRGTWKMDQLKEHLWMALGKGKHIGLFGMVKMQSVAQDGQDQENFYCDQVTADSSRRSLGIRTKTSVWFNHSCGIFSIGPEQKIIIGYSVSVALADLPAGRAESCLRQHHGSQPGQWWWDGQGTCSPAAFCTASPACGATTSWSTSADIKYFKFFPQESEIFFNAKWL